MTVTYQTINDETDNTIICVSCLILSHQIVMKTFDGLKVLYMTDIRFIEIT